MTIWRGIGVVAVLLGVMSAANAQAPSLPLSTDGTDPATWEPARDALAAAPDNHQLLFENEDVRVLSVVVRPGERENVHHHRWPSIIVFVSPSTNMQLDASGRQLPAPPASTEIPFVARIPSQAAHAIQNTDTKGAHLIRVEYKRGFPR